MKKIAIVTLGIIALIGQLTFFMPQQTESAPAVEYCDVHDLFYNYI